MIFDLLAAHGRAAVSVLFNEPKLLKSTRISIRSQTCRRFSALQRAEIAEIFTAPSMNDILNGFSALQRAEIAEIDDVPARTENGARFSALQRAEIAEMWDPYDYNNQLIEFQCSSTSRNC